MRTASEITFTRLSDGTLLERQSDGSFRPVQAHTDHARLVVLAEAETEAMSRSDPDHPGLVDDFWAAIGDPPSGKEAISIKLDRDVLRFFRQEGRGYQTRINAVLRSYMQAKNRGG